MQLPTVKGSNLLRQKMMFPDDFAGSINLVFIAFLRRHQDLIDEWVPFVEELAKEHRHPRRAVPKPCPGQADPDRGRMGVNARARLAVAATTITCGGRPAHPSVPLPGSRLPGHRREGAFRALGQHRSARCKVPQGRVDEECLTNDIIELVDKYGRYEY